MRCRPHNPATQKACQAGVSTCLSAREVSSGAQFGTKHVPGTFYSKCSFAKLPVVVQSRQKRSRVKQGTRR